MPANKPEECDLLLFEVIDTGDIDAALALYEPEAVFVVAPGHVVTGHAAIREVLQGMMAANATASSMRLQQCPVPTALWRSRERRARLPGQGRTESLSRRISIVSRWCANRLTEHGVLSSMTPVGQA